MIKRTAELLPATVDDASDLWECAESFKPRPRPRLLVWSVRNIMNDERKPYDTNRYPHNGAPGGPMDAYDDPLVRTISLQYATRLGKTFTVCCALLHTADTNPAPILFASEGTGPLKRVVGRMYESIYQSRQLRSNLATQNRREHGKEQINFKNCKMSCGWARSPATLGDLNIKVGAANELDKPGWDIRTTSKEAEPQKLFDDRFKDYQSVRKVFYESTPTRRGHSRIEARRLEGTNCSYWVPCPHCHKYQVLRFVDPSEKKAKDPCKRGRVAWERAPSGRHSKEHARKTAHYICEHRGCKITDEYRPMMMRMGVWAPEGCKVHHKKAKAASKRWWEHLTSKAAEDGEQLFTGWTNADWIVGQPARDVDDASYQLSSLYALSLSWGDIAAEFVSCKDKPTKLRNFITQWLGETWEDFDRDLTWEQLGKKLIVPREREVIPNWASVLTATIDWQQSFYVWSVDAWGEAYRNATVAYGDALSLDEILADVLQKTWLYEDGEQKRIDFALTDSGHLAPDVYQWCKECVVKHRIQNWPCKGSSTALPTEYKLSKLGPNTSMPGMTLFLVDTISTQSWIDKCLYALKPGERGSMEIHAGDLEQHQDYLEQLLNDASVLEPDRSNNMRERWMKTDPDVPNDYRDLKRYGKAAAVAVSRNNIKDRIPLAERKEGPKKRGIIGKLDPFGTRRNPPQS